ncbi:MAG: hypothetical protein K9H14_07920 [Actinomycetia bacterium]|nr:hypothetical protein [Actinomycetes bacterium]
MELWEQDPKGGRVPRCDKIKIVIELEGAGAVWFDNVSLKDNTPPPPLN